MKPEFWSARQASLVPSIAREDRDRARGLDDRALTIRGRPVCHLSRSRGRARRLGPAPSSQAVAVVRCLEPARTAAKGLRRSEHSRFAQAVAAATGTGGAEVVKVGVDAGRVEVLGFKRDREALEIGGYRPGVLSRSQLLLEDAPVAPERLRSRLAHEERRRCAAGSRSRAPEEGSAPRLGDDEGGEGEPLGARASACQRSFTSGATRRAMRDGATMPLLTVRLSYACVYARLVDRCKKTAGWEGSEVGPGGTLRGLWYAAVGGWGLGPDARERAGVDASQSLCPCGLREVDAVGVGLEGGVGFGVGVGVGDEVRPRDGAPPPEHLARGRGQYRGRPVGSRQREPGSLVPWRRRARFCS